MTDNNSKFLKWRAKNYYASIKFWNSFDKAKRKSIDLTKRRVNFY